MKTPDYCLSETYQHSRGYGHEPIILPQGAFVRPINPEYLPRHIKESDEFRWFDASQHVFVYCRAGILRIPSNIVRRV